MCVAPLQFVARTAGYAAAAAHALLRRRHRCLHRCRSRAAAKEGAAGGGLKEHASSRPTGQKQLAGLRVWFAAQLLPQKLRL